MNTAHNSTIEITLGDNIRAERNRKRLTQHELARLTGVNVATICQIEKGKRAPALETLRGIARALNCSLDILVPPVAA